MTIMMNSSCFWSLVSFDNLKFLYIPSSIGSIKISTNHITIEDILLHHSLYEFMHPNEIDLAKADLSSFIKLKTLAGSVTRCRLKSFKSIVAAATTASEMSTSNSLASQHGIDATQQQSDAYQKIDQDTFWNIIDLVIYTATDETFLVFFHNTDFEAYYQDNDVMPSQLSCCQGKNNFCSEDALKLIQVFQRQQQQQQQQDIAYSYPNTTIFPIRTFQIIDQSSGIPLFSWPQQNSSANRDLIDLAQSMTKEMTIKEFKSSSYDDYQQEDISCTRHFYASKKSDFLKEICLFQRILIPYGNVIFESFQVSQAAGKISSTIYSPLYQHYFMNHAATNANACTITSAQSPFNYDFDQKNDNYTTNTAATSGPYNIHSDSETTKASMKELEFQILPLVSLSVDSDPNQQPYFFSNTNASFPVVVADHSSRSIIIDSSSSTSFLQKSIIQQQQDGEQQQFLQPKNAYYPSSTEKKRRAMFNNAQQQRLLFESTQGNAVVKMCARCRTSNSPEWRRGPDGHKTLCNACGLRYSRFRSKQWRSVLSSTSNDNSRRAAATGSATSPSPTN